MAIELPELLLPDAPAWRDWLAEHHAGSPGVWLVLHKKGGTVTELAFEQALDHALCFGWVDGQIGRRDEGSYRTRFTPRGPKSRWSKNNVANVQRLDAAGLMTDAGRAVVDAAKADGRWELAYSGQATAEVPEDLAAAIAAVPAAQAMFDVLTSVNRFALIYRVGTVKRAETRARKISEYVAMLARQETIYPQRQKP
ncbi:MULTISPECIES: YdeI/OmpD-associated family protein [Arthrobacter]|uniref:YdeI/OmpD-associated family protein n=2 Tax=Arthrobacter TaxID=1663 RepID=A0ABU9KP78_9MICC|nr:YdeI/OmpD-associated family protein [Arthrobacter sp. YJM1]MDP5228710.1 YdeI/OmpD-associated family protein [Arthrobacter sp. YJM1]